MRESMQPLVEKLRANDVHIISDGNTEKCWTIAISGH